MNPRREPAYLIRDWLKEVGQDRFSLSRDTDTFLQWVQADPLAAVAWKTVRNYWQLPDREIVQGCFADGGKNPPLRTGALER